MPRGANPYRCHSPGSRGLGRTVADFLAAQSYDLVITSRGEEELEATARELRRYGGQVIALAGDVADPEPRRRRPRRAPSRRGSWTPSGRRGSTWPA